ncbi:19484_t:CDS:2 [Funneliformis geosporum]|uniref:10132_t:CDS:1 n=1 Tax=Funneliformis geosporum TaxID=1117311 RepID=A0A9W4WNX4_9GLOM|nr:19484_t:CDS:2 [Funneliformis geosporum]CAI2175993.1 10132_t:CDS:2 [Funneliformis geosporum]
MYESWEFVESQRHVYNLVDRFSSLTVSSSQRSFIVNFPCEVFIDICKFLPPVDLVTLSVVCKMFRNWLVARSNFGTEQIWRMARINWLPHLRTPPKGMSEQCYVFLNLIELGCQFCGSGKVDPNGQLPYDTPAKIYWCFRVRCCQRCFLEKSVTLKQIEDEGQVNRDVLQGLPYYYKKNRPIIYWRNQVEVAHQEYMKLDKIDIYKWSIEKSDHLRNLNKMIASCSVPDRSDSSKKCQIKLDSLINQLSFVVPNDANRSQLKVIVQLKRCPTYKKYTPNNQEARLAMSLLFNENHWILFQNFIRQEYEEKRIYAASRARRYDIFRKIYSMIPEKFSMNDPLVQYLPYCLSFKKPPFHNHDPTIPWIGNFLENTLIPTLCEEAAAIAKVGKCQPITTPSGVFKLLVNQRVFHCKLCEEGRMQVYDFGTVQWHLHKLHEIRRIVKKKMITVDYLAFGMSLLKRDSELVCFFYPLDG